MVLMNMQEENKKFEDLSIEEIEKLINETKKDIISLKKDIYNKSKFILENLNK